MEVENKDVYEKRDILLGRIDERTAEIPEMRKDIKDLHGRMSKVEVKSTFLGMFGAGLVFAAMKIKTMFGVG